MSTTTAGIDELVLDTNVLLDWLVFRNPEVLSISDALRGRRLRWVATAAMLKELGHVLHPALLARWQVSAEQVWQTVEEHVCRVDAPEPAPKGQRMRCRDADDQIFIDLALARQCAWLVTRDRALLKLASRARAAGVAVLTPPDWNSRRAAAETADTAASEAGLPA